MVILEAYYIRSGTVLFPIEPLCSTIFINQSDTCTYHNASELEKIYKTLTFNKRVHYRFSKKTLRYKDFSEIKIIELRNTLWLASCLSTFFCQFYRFCFDMAEQFWHVDILENWEKCTFIICRWKQVYQPGVLSNWVSGKIV